MLKKIALASAFILAALTGSSFADTATLRAGVLNYSLPDHTLDQRYFFSGSTLEYWQRSSNVCSFSGGPSDDQYIMLTRLLDPETDEPLYLFALVLPFLVSDSLPAARLEIRSAGRRFRVNLDDQFEGDGRTRIILADPDRYERLIEVLVSDAPIHVGPMGGTRVIATFDRLNLNEILEDILSCFD